MSLDVLVEAELVRHEWSRIRESDGPATSIPIAFRELLASNSPDESTNAYWKLENHVVLQGSLFEAAAYIVPAICAALVDKSRARWVRIQLLGLLDQIVFGEPHPEEVARGLGDLAVRCQDAAREGLWTLYRIFQEGELSQTAGDIIELVDHDTGRLDALRKLNSRSSN
jgi:hypothetical protein